VTRNEERELWWRANEFRTHSDPARCRWAWEVIWTLSRVARDSTVHARARAMVEERTGCDWLLSEDRTVIVAVLPRATVGRTRAARAARVAAL
jgi:hypothetical protein